jgi:hypothetical protein
MWQLTYRYSNPGPAAFSRSHGEAGARTVNLGVTTIEARQEARLEAIRIFRENPNRDHSRENPVLIWQEQLDVK